MKKVLTFIIIFTILFIPIFNKTSYYTYAESNLIQQRHKEKNYLKETGIKINNMNYNKFIHIKIKN